MATPIAMPKLGMTMEEGMVVDWPLALGSEVAHGDVVLVIESDKSEIDVEATGKGTLHHIYVQPEEVVPCGTLLAVLVDESDVDFDPAVFRDQWDAERETVASPDTATESPAVETRATSATPTKRGGAAMTPAARKLARELGIEPANLTGTGPGGRITREDVEAASQQRASLSEASGGVSLEVPSLGEGPQVLLLPGFGTDISAFSAQTPALAKKFQVRGVNPRGIGASEAPPTDSYEIETMAADVAALIEEPACVVGTSLGSAVAMELALSYPEKVRAMALLAPLIEVPARLAAVTSAWCELADSATPQVLAANLLPWFFGSATLADRKRRQQILRGLSSTLAKAPAQTLRRTHAGLEKWSGTRAADIATIAVPTLVVTAGEDLLTPGGERIAERIPGASLLEIPGAGHAVGLEAPEEINQALIAHFGSTRKD